MSDHSAAFTKVRDLVLTLEEPERARLAQLFGAMNEPKKPLWPAGRGALRAIATLDDDDLERLVGWFTPHVNGWGRRRALVGFG